MCFCCLGPFQKCRDPRARKPHCSSVDKIPPFLLCNPCSHKRTGPISLLFCGCRRHESPLPSDYLSQLGSFVAPSHPGYLIRAVKDFFSSPPLSNDAALKGHQVAMPRGTPPPPSSSSKSTPPGVPMPGGTAPVSKPPTTSPVH